VMQPATISLPEAISTMQKILDAKVAFGQSIISAAITWWVSSVVFCAAILGGTWAKRAEVLELHKEKLPLRLTYFHGFFGLITFFFCTIVVFGVIVIRIFCSLERGIELLEAQMSSSLHASLASPVGPEFKAAACATAVGTFSFVLILIAWGFMWKLFWSKAGTQTARPSC